MFPQGVLGVSNDNDTYQVKIEQFISDFRYDPSTESYLNLFYLIIVKQLECIDEYVIQYNLTGRITDEDIKNSFKLTISRIIDDYTLAGSVAHLNVNKRNFDLFIKYLNKFTDSLSTYSKVYSNIYKQIVDFALELKSANNG